MKKHICAMYFSPTDTTKLIVTEIATSLSSRFEETTDSCFDFTLPNARSERINFSPEDLVIFGVPVYAGRVPNILLDYLNTIKGMGALAVPIVVYGNRNFDDALIELRNILMADGFYPIAAGAFIGEHAFSDTLAKSRPDSADLKCAAQFADQIFNKLTLLPSHESLPLLSVKGEEPYRPYYVPKDRAGNPVNILKVRPLTSDSCDHCGLCAKLCPVGSINPDNEKEFIGICIKCGACIKKCPKKAKYYDDYNYLYHKTELELGYTRRAEPELFL